MNVFAGTVALPVTAPIKVVADVAVTGTEVVELKRLLPAPPPPLPPELSCCVNELVDVQKYRFCPAVASDLKNTSPTVQVPGMDVPVFAGAVLVAPANVFAPV